MYSKDSIGLLRMFPSLLPFPCYNLYVSGTFFSRPVFLIRLIILPVTYPSHLGG